MSSLLLLKPDISTAILPCEDVLNESNCSYFVAIWGPVENFFNEPTSVYFPTPMNANALAARERDVQELRDKVISLRDWGVASQVVERANSAKSEIAELSGELQLRKREMRAAHLSAAAASAENRLLRDSVWRLQNALSEAQDARANSAKLENAKLSTELQLSKRETRAARLSVAALSAENRLLRDSVWRVQNALSEAQAEHVKLAATVPWRVVGLYRRVRRYIPSSLLEMAARMMDLCRAVMKRLKSQRAI